MSNLTKYEAARRALAEASRVDEVKDIHNKADAMQRYALQAKDRELIDMATDIKMRAERRVGELLREMSKNKGTRGAGDANVGKSTGGRLSRPPVDATPKLSDLGVTKDQSSRWQKLAAMPEKQFEEKVAAVKGTLRAKTEGVSRPKKTERPAAPRGPDERLKQRNEKIIALADRGIPTSQIAAEIGIVQRVINQVLEREKIRRDAKAEPVVGREDLSLSAQEKLDAVIRQHKRKLQMDFELAVREEARKRMDEIILPHWKQQIAQAQDLYKRRNGLMDKATFNAIRRALHPDSRNSVSDKILAEAFDKFMRLEKYLLNEANSPTTWGDLPSSAAEWDKMRVKRAAAKRPNKQPVSTR